MCFSVSTFPKESLLHMATISAFNFLPCICSPSGLHIGPAGHFNNGCSHSRQLCLGYTANYVSECWQMYCREVIVSPQPRSANSQEPERHHSTGSRCGAYSGLAIQYHDGCAMSKHSNGFGKWWHFAHFNASHTLADYYVDYGTSGSAVAELAWCNMGRGLINVWWWYIFIVLPPYGVDLASSTLFITHSHNCS